MKRPNQTSNPKTTQSRPAITPKHKDNSYAIVIRRRLMTDKQRHAQQNSNQMMRAFKTKNKHDHNKHLGQFSWTQERRSHQHQMQERLRITHGQHHRQDADVFAEILREALHIQPQPATTTMTPITMQEPHDAVHQLKKSKHQTREVSPQK